MRPSQPGSGRERLRWQSSFWCKLNNGDCPGAFVCWEAPIRMRRGNSAALSGSRPGADASRGCAALLFLALAFSPPTAAAQRTPQPVFTELFSYDPTVPSELLGKWRQLDSKLQPLRVGVVED